MRIPLNELRKLCPELPGGNSADIARHAAAALVRVGLEEEAIHGADLTGPIVVGRVLSAEPEPQKNGKVIHWCQVRVGPDQINGVVCGADNFRVGDFVAVALPGAVLPGGFEISARKTYGHLSVGMLCSEKELGLGEDHQGILVLTTQDIAPELLVPGVDVLPLLGADELTLEINVTPDRGYCFSFRGIAREYSLSTETTFVDPVGDQLAVPAASADGFEILVRDQAPVRAIPGCSRYVARVLTGFAAGAPSPTWLRRALTNSGMRPISLAVDVTNYVMLLTGQPLHAFDLNTLGERIVVRRAEPGEQLTTLDGVERTLDPEDLVISDERFGKSRVLALAGVMGGASSEVSADTTELLVEAAHFDPVSIARTSRRHRLSTEASRRYERGVDVELAPRAAELAVQLLLSLGGAVAGPVTTAGESAAVLTIQLPLQLAADVMGVDVSPDFIEQALARVGCSVELVGSKFAVIPPSWRPDLRFAIDLVEEVARIFGYNNIAGELPQAPAGRGLTKAQRLARSAGRTLAEQGLVEVLSYPFVDPKRHSELGFTADDARREAVSLINPLNDQAPELRTNLLATLLDAARRNVGRGAREIALFEMGRVFRPRAGQPKVRTPAGGVRPSSDVLAAVNAQLPEQPLRAAWVLGGRRELASWWGPGRDADWSDAVAVAQHLARALNVGELVVTADQHAPWHPGRCAKLTLADGTLVGHAGELAPAVVTALELPARSVAAEIDLDIVLAAAPDVVLAQPISSHPVALRDIALIVDEGIPAAKVSAAIRRGAGELLVDLRIFDDYRGEKVGVGKRSLAYRLVLRAPDRTLTGAEATAAMDAAVAEAARTFGAILRDGS